MIEQAEELHWAGDLGVRADLEDERDAGASDDGRPRGAEIFNECRLSKAELEVGPIEGSRLPLNLPTRLVLLVKRRPTLPEPRV
jgi:hypothetical protein